MNFLKVQNWPLAGEILKLLESFKIESIVVNGQIWIQSNLFILGMKAFIVFLIIKPFHYYISQQFRFLFRNHAVIRAPFPISEIGHEAMNLGIFVDVANQSLKII